VKHASRGQVFPLWIVAVLTTFTLSFLAIDYGNSVRYQIRAQNAADAAAQAVMALQSQRFNETALALYNANVEEFRIRSLLHGMVLSLSGVGACTWSGGTYPHYNAPGTASTDCMKTFDTLLKNYDAASNRYTTDVARLNDAAASLGTTAWESDASSLLATLAAHCNGDTTTTPNTTGGDCQVKYTLNGIGNRRTGIIQVANDTYNVFMPDAPYIIQGTPLNAQNENTALDPGFVDITTCITVPPVIPTFGFLHLPSYHAIGRAGATATAAESDWFMPEMLTDNVRGGYFQPSEEYVSPSITDASGNNWYDVNYGGANWAITPVTYPPPAGTVDRYVTTVSQNEFSPMLAWWTAIPYDPSQIDAATPTVSCP
jgi:hypothetical protein